MTMVATTVAATTRRVCACAKIAFVCLAGFPRARVRGVKTCGFALQGMCSNALWSACPVFHHRLVRMWTVPSPCWRGVAVGGGAPLSARRFATAVLAPAVRWRVAGPSAVSCNVCLCTVCALRGSCPYLLSARPRASRCCLVVRSHFERCRGCRCLDGLKITWLCQSFVMTCLCVWIG